MKYQLTQELLTKVLNYLATKPFNEVAGIISEIDKELKENIISKPEEGNV